jgi:hypothetical protein
MLLATIRVVVKCCIKRGEAMRLLRLELDIIEDALVNGHEAKRMINERLR